MPRRATTREGLDVASAILPATATLISRSGTAGATLAALARNLGVSIRPIRNRYPDAGTLLIRSWQSRLWPALADRLGAVVALREAADEEGLRECLTRFSTRDDDADATAELILHARFDPGLRATVADSLGVLVTAATSPRSARAGANAFVLALALGLMIGARHDRATRLDLEQALPAWVHSATTPGEPVALPVESATHMDDYPRLAPGDPALDILLNTALEMIGERGFDQVTVSQIARAAGFTEGLAFRRYPTKLAMLRDATKRQNDAGMALNHAFTTALQATHGTAIAEAVTLREAQRPGRALGRSMALEQIRLGWHHAELAAAQGTALDGFRAGLLATPGWAEYESETDFFLQFALSWGMYLLPFLNPEVHTLPYDCVLVGLYDTFADRLGQQGDRS